MVLTKHVRPEREMAFAVFPAQVFQDSMVARHIVSCPGVGVVLPLALEVHFCIFACLLFFVLDVSKLIPALA